MPNDSEVDQRRCLDDWRALPERLVENAKQRDLKLCGGRMNSDGQMLFGADGDEQRHEGLGS